ncbi:MAG: hypothetical protein M3Y31_01700, partial [Gemmatimonadota bacterium]|nr:hypothetical protein [Gemmatimonadota bacterium]
MRQLRSARRTRLALVLAVLATPAMMSAQTAPLTIPGGALRVSLGAGMDTWNDVLPGPGQPVAIDAAQATRLTGSLGLAIGLTSRFTLFGSLPFERMRVQATASEAGVDIPGDRAAGPGDAAAGIAWRIAGAAPD